MALQIPRNKQITNNNNNDALLHKARRTEKYIYEKYTKIYKKCEKYEKYAHKIL